MLLKPKIKRAATLVLGRNSKNAGRRKLFSIGRSRWIIYLYRFLLKSARFYASRFLYLSRVIPRGKRFIFAAIALLFIFTGMTPFDLFKGTIRALTGKTEIINLYAGNCSSPGKSDDFRAGWWKEEKAAGAPDLGPDADQLAFSDENSAFYSGGDYSLKCGGFMFLEEDADQAEANGVNDNLENSENKENNAPAGEPESEDDNMLNSDNELEAESGAKDSIMEGEAEDSENEDGAKKVAPENTDDNLSGAAEDSVGEEENNQSADGADGASEADGSEYEAVMGDSPAGADINPGEPGNSGDGTLNRAGGSEQVEIKAGEEENTNVEIIEAPEDAAAAEIVLPENDSSTDSADSAPVPEASEGEGAGPVSFFKKSGALAAKRSFSLKDYFYPFMSAPMSLGYFGKVLDKMNLGGWAGESFGGKQARAQEFLSKKAGELKDLGKFRGAKIKFSLAFMSGAKEDDDLNLPEDELGAPAPEDESENLTEANQDNSAEEGLGPDNTAEGRSETDFGEEEAGGETEKPAEADAYESEADSPEDDGSGEEDNKADNSGTDGQGFNGGDSEEASVVEYGNEGEDNSQSVKIIEKDNSEAEVEVKKNEAVPKTPVENEPKDISFLDKFIKSARARTGEAKLIIWYSLGANTASSGAEIATSEENILWQKLDALTGENLSNAANNGYLSYELDFIKNWRDIKNLKIKIEGAVDSERAFTAYLDSVWVEAEYEPESELDKLKKRQRWEEALDLLSDKLVFRAGEDGILRFRYNKNEDRLWDNLAEMVGLGNFWKNVKLEAKLIDSHGKDTGYPLSLVFSPDGEFSVSLPDGLKEITPGEYTIRFHIEDDSGDEAEIFDFEQKFSWGILAINFNKSVYKPGDTGFIQMAVLDSLGHTVCGAELEMEIKNLKSGQVDVLNTEEKIIKNPECGPETKTEKPDYYAYYEFKERGEYEIKLKAKTEAGEKEITDKIEVKGGLPFIIERAGPTRIYPKADYGMEIKIKASKDFEGDIVEPVPPGFKITNYKLQITNSSERDPFGADYKYYVKDDGSEGKKLVWHDVDIMAGDELEIAYSFDAPDESPEFYLLGPIEAKPLRFADANRSGLASFSESRQWQIAADALNKRARTVMFLGGTYSGNGTGGQSTNVDSTFSAFNFKLAETGVSIKSAFVMFEAQIEAYNSTGGDYTGYKLYFDSCEETCTANAISGTDRVLEDDSNILAYDETESNQVRLLFDVTSEAQLAAYTGAGADMEAQIGYYIKNGTTKDSIANAKAVLYLTYTYDADSPNVTNTVIYPLDSTAAGDSGSLQSHQEGDCTFGTDCPSFAYNMEIPEFPSAMPSARLADWYRVYEINDNHGSTDVQVSMQISGQSTPSATFVHEAANAGTQGNIPAMYFSSLTGFSENTAQTVEYRSITGSATHDHAIEGGEVFETYIASSSAATSTRTVSFPIGIINNGNTTSLTSGETEVYFPENGNATGTVKIKKAWLRILSHEHNTGARTIEVSTKVGNNATSSTYTYNYNVGGSVVKPAFMVIHIIPGSPTTDYAALEEANAANPVRVRVAAKNDNVDVGGTSAELLITYTYTSEAKGYLTNLRLFAGQSGTDPATSTVLSTANSVFPEPGSKSVYAAGLWASYLNSDNLGSVGAGTVFLLDADLSTSSSPVCAPAYRAEPDDINSFTELYKNVADSMDTTDDRAYYACYADDEALTTSDGARMNGILSYTYGWKNTAPTSTIASAVKRADGSGVIDLTITVGDIDGQGARAKFEYATGTSCDFSSPGDASIDETDANITAAHGDPDADNSLAYQIGTPSAYIGTASGTNSVYFDWLAADDLGAVEGDYCLRLTANDQLLDQASPATATVYIDTLAPTAPGALSLNSRTGATTTLNFGATTTETNFSEYKIFYKEYDGTDPTESDGVWASSSDANLGNILFNGKATTSIGGLSAKTTYSFAIWAYDVYGNRASSSRVDIETNDAPSGVFNSAGQKTDGSGTVDISIEVDDLNNDDTNIAKIEYVAGAACDFSSPGDPTLDENSANIQADFGSPVIDNSQDYQVGSSTGYILTSVGSNTVDFDWAGASDLPAADGTYCLRLTVNDGLDDQAAPATTTLTLDNVNPSPTGDLMDGGATTNSIRLIFATTSLAADTNEPTTDAYKIFYKKGTSGAAETDSEHDDAALNAYDYNGATSTLVSGLDSNSWYVFNIWAYDTFGNKAAAAEVAIKTNATISNDSLTFVNPQTSGTSTNIAVASGTTEWIFRAIVAETNGWYAIASTTLRLADNSDNSPPFSDLAFSWDQTSNSFSEIGADAQGAAALSNTSTSTCSGNTCTLDFKIVFNKNFTSPSTEYTAELYSGNDSGVIDHDSYDNFYQVRYPYVEQIHYRWRNDDGGE